MAQTATNRVSSDGAIDYTPSGAAVTGGDVVVVGEIVGVCVTDLADGEKGSLQVTGVFRFPKATGAITVGAKVYWDEDGNPVTGDAGSGAATTTATSNKLAGYAVAAAASGDSYVDVWMARA